MARKQSPHPARHRLALAAALALSAPLALAVDFSGFRPVYVGSWFNGSTTEVQEFQFALDWQGWCNAHPGSSCQQITFWNVAGNWDGNTIPAANGTARVLAGQTVRVGGFNSLYLGPISGGAIVGTLDAAGRVEVHDYLRVVNASFADLLLYPVIGQLDTTGLSVVSHLSSGQGKFGGAGGTTQLGGWSLTSGGLTVLVLQDHTLKLAGVAAAPVPLDIRLVPTARLVNQGVLEMGGGQVWLQGSANVNTLPVFDNTGTLSGSGSVSLHFNNAGTVNLAAGGSLGFSANGTHSGSFSGGTGSTMTFGGLFAGSGHRFLGAVNSGGDVTLSRGRHQASGAWNVARTFVQGGGEITFDGPAPQIGELHVNGGGLHKGATFNSAGGSTLQSVFVDNSGVVEFNAGSSTAQHLSLRDGRLTNQGPLQVAQSFDWHSGALTGAGTMRLPGQTTLHAGTRTMNTNIVLDGTMDWQGGNFSAWAGHMEVLPSGRVNIGGDFGSAGGGGTLINRGVLAKTTGTGRAELAMTVDTRDGGLTRVLAGTLALTGGGRHIDPTFEVAPGARIELSGGTVFGGQVTANGRLDVVGGSFELLANTPYSHGVGQRFEVSDLRIGSGASLALAGPLLAAGSVHNFGSFAAAAPVQISGDFNQQGSFTLAAGASLSVGGLFTSSSPLTLNNSALYAGTLNNPSQLTLTGSINVYLGHLSNAGTLTLLPQSFGSLYASTGFNSGTLRIDGAQLEFTQNGDFVNTGLIVNEGTWQANGGSLRHAGAAARMDNIGILNVYQGSGLALTGGAQLHNTGTVQVQGGSVVIDAGSRLHGSGAYNQFDGLTVVNGELGAGQGVLIDAGTLRGSGTVVGTVSLGANALWQPGNSPGTMTVQGDASLAGRLEIEVASLALHDRLVVSGNFSAGAGSTLALLFDPGFVPQDGDSLQWLQAGSASVYGALDVSGLPAYWSATRDASGAGVEITYDLANAIPLSGNFSIAAGEVGYNTLREPGPTPSLTQLDNAGVFSNRSGAMVGYIGTLNNAPGAQVLNRGTLGTGSVVNDGLIDNRSGSVFQASTLVNRGTLLHNGQADVYADVSNEPGGLIDIGGHMQINQRMNNEGVLRVRGELVSTSGVLFLNRGTVEVAGGGVLSVQGPLWQTSTGLLRVDGLLQAPELTLIGGTLRGTGTVRAAVVNEQATIEPGNSIGTLTIDGDLQGFGYLDLEIGDTASFDRLVVTGNAQIGNVVFRLTGDYRPTPGDSFATLLVGGTLGIIGDNQWVVLRPLLEGWTLWADANGVYDSENPATADWRVSFAGGSLSVTAVPEPESWLLMAGGLLALGALKLQRRRRED
ncbi:MAG: hypothetical protein Q7U73_18745 [Rubrivivax sp.]|nr:hypothetical protein [Rubrivivax sp.]